MHLFHDTMHTTTLVAPGRFSPRPLSDASSLYNVSLKLLSSGLCSCNFVTVLQCVTWPMCRTRNLQFVIYTTFYYFQISAPYPTNGWTFSQQWLLGKGEGTDLGPFAKELCHFAACCDFWRKIVNSPFPPSAFFLWNSMAGGSSAPPPPLCFLRSVRGRTVRCARAVRALCENSAVFHHL